MSDLVRNREDHSSYEYNRVTYIITELYRANTFIDIEIVCTCFLISV